MATRRSERISSQQPANPSIEPNEPSNVLDTGVETRQNVTNDPEIETTNRVTTPEPTTESGETEDEGSPIPTRPLASYTREEIRNFTPEQRLAYKARVEHERAQRELDLEVETLFHQAQALAAPRGTNLPVRSTKEAPINGPTDPIDISDPVEPITVERTGQASSKPQKRRRASSSEEDRKPPVVNVKEFRGESIEEKMTYDIKMKNHFARHRYYYDVGNTDLKRILAAEETLSDTISKKWYTFQQDGNDIKDMTWDDFDAFLTRTIKDPKLLTIEAECKLEDAAQRESQTVSDFNVYLRSWERHLTVRATEAQRKVRLRTKILPNIRKESISRNHDEPDDYDRYVVWLQTLEDGMSERQEALKRAKNRQNTNIRNNRRDYTPDSRSSRRQYHGRNEHRNDRERNPNRYNGRDRADKTSSGPKDNNTKPDRDITCNYCGKKGHYESQCYQKHPELKPTWPNRK
jgi:hypothetical protein